MSSFSSELLLLGLLFNVFYLMGFKYLVFDLRRPPVIGLLLCRSEWNPLSSKRIALVFLFLVVSGAVSGTTVACLPLIILDFLKSIKAYPMTFFTFKVFCYCSELVSSVVYVGQVVFLSMISSFGVLTEKVLAFNAIYSFTFFFSSCGIFSMMVSISILS